MKLVNMRLNGEDAVKLAALRRRGVQASALFREAVRSAYDRTMKKSKGIKDVHAYFRELYARYPKPPNTPPREFDPHDRLARQEWIARHLRSEVRQP